MENVNIPSLPFPTTYRYTNHGMICRIRFFTQVYETDPDDAYQADPDQIWLDLCNRGTEAYNGAIHCCQQFLKDYVRASERPVVSTGPEERRIERSINRDLSVRHFWESLVVAADRTVLSEKRRSVTSNPDKWTLSTTQSHKSRGSGPVWQISHVSPIPVSSGSLLP